MWVAIALVSGAASAAGYGLFQDASPGVLAFVLTFAAGAILTMLANTMMPEAFDEGVHDAATGGGVSRLAPDLQEHVSEFGLHVEAEVKLVVMPRRTLRADAERDVEMG